METKWSLRIGRRFFGLEQNRGKFGPWELEAMAWRSLHFICPLLLCSNSNLAEQETRTMSCPPLRHCPFLFSPKAKKAVWGNNNSITKSRFVSLAKPYGSRPVSTLSISWKGKKRNAHFHLLHCCCQKTQRIPRRWIYLICCHDCGHQPEVQTGLMFQTTGCTTLISGHC